MSAVWGGLFAGCYFVARRYVPGAIAILGATAPDAAPDIASPGRDVRLPGPNQRSVTYSVGNDASITIERIIRDGAVPR